LYGGCDYSWPGTTEIPPRLRVNSKKLRKFQNKQLLIPTTQQEEDNRLQLRLFFYSKSG
jgi:hypothetical protein